MSIIRYVGVEGRISLPKEFRELNQIDSHTTLILTKEEDSIVFSFRSDHCIFCASTSNTIVFKTHNVCKKCVGTVSEEYKPVTEVSKVTYEELLPKKIREYHNLILSHPGIKQHEAAQILGFSQQRVSKMKRKIAEVSHLLSHGNIY